MLRFFGEIPAPPVRCKKADDLRALIRDRQDRMQIIMDRYSANPSPDTMNEVLEIQREYNGLVLKITEAEANCEKAAKYFLGILPRYWIAAGAGVALALYLGSSLGKSQVAKAKVTAKSKLGLFKAES